MILLRLPTLPLFSGKAPAAFCFLLALLSGSITSFAADWLPANPSVSPGKFVGQLIVFYRDGQIRSGSGTLVGQSHVLTAGHCLIKGRGQDKWDGKPESVWKPIGVMFTPGANGKAAPYGSANATKWAISNGFLDGTVKSRDYGIVRLNRALGSRARQSYKTAGGHLYFEKWEKDTQGRITIFGYGGYSTSQGASLKTISDLAFNVSSWSYFSWWNKTWD